MASSHIRVGTFAYFAAREDGEGLRILSLSRLAPEKNLDRLIAALPALLERDPGTRVTLAG